MSGHKTKPWQPLERGAVNPPYALTVYGVTIAAGRESIGLPNGTRVEVWGSDLYSVVVEHYPNGSAYLSIKRQDRHAIRDWRHLQSIKNEVVGAEREAVELFPAESRLMDEANQYHLWVAPEGVRFPYGQQERTVQHPAEIREHNRQVGGRARQRAWQPGLSTGPTARPVGREGY